MSRTRKPQTLFLAIPDNLVGEEVLSSHTMKDILDLITDGAEMQSTDQDDKIQEIEGYVVYEVVRKYKVNTHVEAELGEELDIND